MGTLVDSLACDDDPPWLSTADGEDATLELIDPDADNGRPGNWAASNTTGGSPGGTNTVATGTVDGDDTPAAGLVQNFPNPFSTSTRITYRVSAAGHVRLDVYDVTGRRVQTLVDVTQPPATYDVVWQPEDMAAGLYLYRLTIDGEPVQTGRAAVVK